ncbi:hypothetical protein CL657_05795 [bacterium]|nr:hypothetical protein [bacterium]
MKKKHTLLIANKQNKLKTIYQILQKNHIPIIKMNQTHSNNIQIIMTAPKKRITTVLNTDGLITNQKNIAIAVKFADCMPIIIQAHGYLCLLHSGRKGTQKKIITKALSQLKNLTQKDNDFQIWIGPHICNLCYEINPKTNETYDMLSQAIIQIKSELDISRNTLSINTECTKKSVNYYSYRGNNYTKKRNFFICYQQ